MRTPSATELLDIWELCMTQPPAQRGLTLLATGCPDTPPGDLARFSAGQRDGHILRLREGIFGAELVSITACRACGEQLEASVKTDEVLLEREPSTEPPEPATLAVAEYEVRYRLPDSLDLAGIAGQPDVASARKELLRRCILSARNQDGEIPLDALPETVLTAMTEQMARADPQANVQLALTCPACGRHWEETLDVVNFFWSELNAWAERLLLEVHTLASAYGWRETEIVAMSPVRRRIYLEMLSP
jgi:hypothetical protein